MPAKPLPVPDSRIRRRIHYGVAFALYVVLAGLFIHDWDGFVFENSVRDFWHGKTPYAVAEEQPFYTFLGINDVHPQWYAYPPLALLAMSVTYLPEILFDVPPFLERALLKLPMVLGTLFVAFVGEAWAKHLGKPPEIGRRVRALLLFNPFLILIGPVWGMTDPALIAFLLFGALRFQEGRTFESGVWVALSALIKPFPVLLSLPLAAYFLYEQGWRKVGRSFSAACLTGIGICLPFLLTTPRGFIQQIAVFHLARPVQGFSIWRLVPQNGPSPESIEAASFALMAISLLLLALLAPRIRSPVAPILITLAASFQILFWNRVVNDQYLVLLVAPLILLYGFKELETATSRRAARLVPAFLAVVTVLIGWHFLTFIPPDIALPAFGKPVDAVAEEIRQHFAPLARLNLPTTVPDRVTAALFVLGLGANVILSYRFVRRWIPALAQPLGTRHRELHSRAYAVAATSLVVMMALLPVGAPGLPEARAESAPENPLVGAFYYLWWHNPAHDPTIRYGNWLKVSQTPDMGYYTNTRGVARDHVRMMLESGINVAVVSYHTGEFERLQVFMEEAALQGLLVAPLVELNQIYDRLDHHPLGPDGNPVPYAAYRLDDGTREAIEDFVLELKGAMGPSAPLYRVDGRPVLFFYDSYVSAVSYDESSKRLLAAELLDTYGIQTLRTAFDDPRLRPTADDVVRHYPAPNRSLGAGDNPSIAFYEGNRTPSTQYAGFQEINQSAYWRVAHLNLHRDFWQQIRTNLEGELGPLFLINGDAFNEHAGFEAGIIKGVVANDAFDGSFIYSPSFVWGNHPRDGAGNFFNPYDRIFQSWEDRNIWLNAIVEGSNRFSAYGIAPAYDDTVNRPGFAPSRDPGGFRSIGFQIPAFTETGATYDRMWESAIRYRPDLVLVATFNEFFEGSSIEPSLEYGDRFLEATQAYHHILNNTPRPPDEIVVVTHERLSRTHPAFSESDRPHAWALRLTAGITRAYPNARVVAVDALDIDPAPRGPPALLVIDGGRDAYDATSVSPPMRSLITGWVDSGVPTLIVGREVASPLRELVPTSCRENPVLPLGHAVVPEPPGDGDDELDAGDKLRPNEPSAAYVLLEREGRSYPVGYRCPNAPHVAFVSIKPWTPQDGWGFTQLSDADCLKVMTAPLVPHLAGDELDAKLCYSSDRLAAAAAAPGSDPTEPRAAGNESPPAVPYSGTS